MLLFLFLIVANIVFILIRQQLELKDEVIRKMAEEQRVLDARLARSAAAEHSAGLDASPMAHAVASPPTAGERGGGGADGDGSRGVSETWTLGGYISSLGFSHDLADAMLGPLDRLAISVAALSHDIGHTGERGLPRYLR